MSSIFVSAAPAAGSFFSCDPSSLPTPRVVPKPLVAVLRLWVLESGSDAQAQKGVECTVPRTRCLCNSPDGRRSCGCDIPHRSPSPRCDNVPVWSRGRRIRHHGDQQTQRVLRAPPRSDGVIPLPSPRLRRRHSLRTRTRNTADPPTRRADLAAERRRAAILLVGDASGHERVGLTIEECEVIDDPPDGLVDLRAVLLSDPRRTAPQRARRVSAAGTWPLGEARTLAA